MVGNIHLVIGGIRSGKSDYSELLAKNNQNQVLYVATGKNTDEHMIERIQKHQQKRPLNWETLEEPSLLSTALLSFFSEKSLPSTILIDSLDFWISNRLIDYPNSTYEQHESWLTSQVNELIKTCQNNCRNTIIVTSEVGASLVSEHAIGRRFQDLLGTINQIVSKASNTVDYVIAGNILNLKS